MSHEDSGEIIVRGYFVLWYVALDLERFLLLWAQFEVAGIDPIVSYVDFFKDFLVFLGYCIVVWVFNLPVGFF